MNKAVRPIGFSAAFVLAANLVPAGAAFAQGGIWRPDPSLGAAPVIEAATFRPGAQAFQPRVAQPRTRGGFALAAPHYRAAAGRQALGQAAFAAPTPTWRSPSRQSRPAERSAPAPWHHRAAMPMPAVMPWAMPLPPSAPAHAGYLAHAAPPVPVWGGAQPVPYPPALAYHGYPYGQQPAAYPPAPVQAPGRWNTPAPGAFEQRPIPGGWRPDPLAASMTAGHYPVQASAYTSPRRPVFRGTPVAGWGHAQAGPLVRPQPARGHWRPDTTVAWTSSQAFRPVAYGRSIARDEQPVRVAAEGARDGRGDLPGWATTLDRFEQAANCAWCGSGT